MTLQEIVARADVGFRRDMPFALIAEQFNPDGTPRPYADNDGDFCPLARYIAHELWETYEPGADDGMQLDEAVRVVEAAITDLQNTRDALYHPVTPTP